jgi:hypothetical protein
MKVRLANIATMVDESLNGLQRKNRNVSRTSGEGGFDISAIGSIMVVESVNLTLRKELEKLKGEIEKSNDDERLCGLYEKFLKEYLQSVTFLMFFDVSLTEASHRELIRMALKLYSTAKELGSTATLHSYYEDMGRVHIMIIAARLGDAAIIREILALDQSCLEARLELKKAQSYDKTQTVFEDLVNDNEDYKLITPTEPFEIGRGFKFEDDSKAPVTLPQVVTGLTLLVYSLAYKSTEMLSMLLEKGLEFKDVVCSRRDNKPRVIETIQHYKILIDHYKSKGMAVCDIRDYYGFSLLHYAVISHDYEAVEYLLSLDDNLLLAKDKLGCTPSYYSIYEVSKCLSDQEAAPYKIFKLLEKACQDKGWEALDLAAVKLAVINFFVEKTRNVKVLNWLELFASVSNMAKHFSDYATPIALVCFAEKISQDKVSLPKSTSEKDILLKLVATSLNVVRSFKTPYQYACAVINLYQVLDLKVDQIAVDYWALAVASSKDLDKDQLNNLKRQHGYLLSCRDKGKSILTLKKEMDIFMLAVNKTNLIVVELKKYQSGAQMLLSAENTYPEDGLFTSKMLEFARGCNFDVDKFNAIYANVSKCFEATINVVNRPAPKRGDKGAWATKAQNDLKALVDGNASSAGIVDTLKLFAEMYKQIPAFVNKSTIDIKELSRKYLKLKSKLPDKAQSEIDAIFYTFGIEPPQTSASIAAVSYGEAKAYVADVGFNLETFKAITGGSIKANNKVDSAFVKLKTSHAYTPCSDSSNEKWKRVIKKMACEDAQFIVDKGSKEKKEILGCFETAIKHQCVPIYFLYWFCVNAPKESVFYDIATELKAEFTKESTVRSKSSSARATVVTAVSPLDLTLVSTVAETIPELTRGSQEDDFADLDLSGIGDDLPAASEEEIAGLHTLPESVDETCKGLLSRVLRGDTTLRAKDIDRMLKAISPTRFQFREKSDGAWSCLDALNFDGPRGGAHPSHGAAIPKWDGDTPVYAITHTREMLEQAGVFTKYGIVRS